jgi:hypothetical protein
MCIDRGNISAHAMSISAVAWVIDRMGPSLDKEILKAILELEYGDVGTGCTNQHQAPVAREQKRVSVGDGINLEVLSGRTSAEGEQQLLSSYNQALEAKNRYHQDREEVLLAEKKWKDDRIAELLSVNKTFSTQESLLDPLNDVACRAFIENLIKQAQLSGSKEEQRLQLAKALSTKMPFPEEEINKTLMYGSTSKCLLA